MPILVTPSPLPPLSQMLPVTVHIQSVRITDGVGTTCLRNCEQLLSAELHQAARARVTVSFRTKVEGKPAQLWAA